MNSTKFRLSGEQEGPGFHSELLFSELTHSSFKFRYLGSSSSAREHQRQTFFMVPNNMEETKKSVNVRHKNLKVGVT